MADGAGGTPERGEEHAEGVTLRERRSRAPGMAPALGVTPVER